ncbi:MAG: tetratricopeptide repeat protein [Clostridia bacterium]|nr:tetratricopeptide repeat protein [Clostridia bacterium]
MSSFSYKTRGNSSPQGKSKVYFACHPEDFHLFEAISDEILREVNCAVFYHTQPITDEEAHLRDLAEMNLIVIPITKKFLTTPSAARDIEFPFSQQNHIPVLPLMQEPGLVDDFNKICGDIQFLDPNSCDSTAISYEEKFKNFLTSILVGDELAEKIRNAFDAYIFLSYRKKDRAYAQELMRLIHENDFCRDVAIWYDEFLIPGENFNNTIAAALEKSKLFALAVTPNLVNEKNYVMTTEYPMAKNAGKTIIPAEVLPTDRKSLESHYPEIPPTVDAHNTKSLADALTNALDGIVLRDNDTDPRHNFFIGLAYLSGIDVEKNPARALSMLTFAAESNVPQAIQKLVTMYKTGEGVERNYETAIHWQEKLVEVYRNGYNKSDHKDDATSYLNAIWCLGDDYQALGKLTEAESTYQTMLTEINGGRLIHILNWQRLIQYRSICYDSLGNIAQKNGDISLAFEYYSKPLAVREALAKFSGKLANIGSKLAKFSGTLEAKWDLAINYDNLGSIALEKGDPALALEYHSKSLALREAIANETGTVLARLYLATSYDNLGKIAFASEDFVLALEYYSKSLALREPIANETRNIQARQDLAASYYNLGDIAFINDDLALSFEYFSKSLAISEAIVKETSSIEARQNLSFVYYRLGVIAEVNDDFTSALKYHLEFLAISEAIAKETCTIQAYDNLAMSHWNLSLFFEDFPKLDSAISHAQEAYAIWKNLAEQCPQVPTFATRRDMAKKLLSSLT